MKGSCSGPRTRRQRLPPGPESEPLRQAVEAQLDIPRTGDSLKASPAAERIRQVLERRCTSTAPPGFLVLAPDGTVIASDLEDAVGLRTLLMLDRALIEGALGGEPQLSPAEWG